MEEILSSVKPSTRFRYQRALAQFSRWFSGDLRFDSISPGVVEEYIRYLEGRGLKPATIRLHISALRKVTGGRDMIKYRGVQPPPSFLTPEETDVLLQTPNLRERAVIALMLAGLTPREIVHLAPISGDGEEIVVPPRRIPLPPAIKEIVLAYQEAGGRGGEVLFSSRTGRPLSVREIHRILEKASRRLGKKVTSRTLRNTFAVNFLRQTGDVLRLAKYLGCTIGTAVKFLSLVEDGGNDQQR